MTGSDTPSSNYTIDLLLRLIGQLGSLGVTVSPNIVKHGNSSTYVSPPVAIRPHLANILVIQAHIRIPCNQASPLSLVPPPAYHYYQMASPPSFTLPLPQPNQLGPTVQPANQSAGQPASLSGNPTTLPHAFNVFTLQDPPHGAWNMDIGASSHLNNFVTSLSIVFNTCMYPSILVGDSHSIPVPNMGHSILPTPFKSLRLNNVLITRHIVKNLIFVRQFVRDNHCMIEFDAFGFFVKDFMTRRVLLRCDSTGIFTQSQLHLLSLMFSCRD
ncbi:hypothetical protein Tco_1512054 [Tanacetum coccineum]